MRRLLILLGAVTLGLVLNVGVAWLSVAGATYRPHNAFIERIRVQPTIERVQIVLNGLGSQYVQNRGRSETLQYLNIPEFVHRGQNWSLLRERFGHQRAFEEEAAGWPLFSLRWHRSDDETLFGGLDCHKPMLLQLQGGPAVLPNGQSVSRTYSVAIQDCILPLRPIWIGMAVNTTLYAVACLLLVHASRCILGWLRERKGRCRRCAYFLTASGSTTCPECGYSSKR